MKFGNSEIDLEKIKSIEDLHNDNGYIIHFLDGSTMNVDCFTAIEVTDAWTRQRFEENK